MIRSLIFVALVAVAYMPGAHAYNIYQKCGDGNGTKPITWSKSPRFFIKTSDFTFAQFQEMKRVQKQYARIADATLRFSEGTSSAGSYGDGSNGVYINYDSGFSALALAKGYYASSNFCDNTTTGGFFIEGDVQFAPQTNSAGADRWSADVADSHSGALPIYIGLVFNHELGHFAGSYGNNWNSSGSAVVPGLTAFHERRLLATMNTYPNGGYLGGNSLQVGDWLVKPLPDDRAMVRFLYPENSSNNYDVAGSRFQRPAGGASTATRYRGRYPVGNGNTRLQRGSGYYMPYTILNLGNTRQAVRVEVWMTSDLKLDGVGADLKLSDNGSPLFHEFDMAPTGADPDESFPVFEPPTRQSDIYFELPDNSSQFPSGSTWHIGFKVTMPNLISGQADSEPKDNWVMYTQQMRVN